jgi:hypothetical protein
MGRLCPHGQSLEPTASESDQSFRDNHDRTTQKKPKKAPSETASCTGDRTLAKSIAFMRDTLWQREMAYATAEGDVGRVYEIMKASPVTSWHNIKPHIILQLLLFQFAGSAHTNYTTYLLEMICRLELESSPELREANLRGLLINLSGRAGAFTASDTLQEFLNRLLEAVIDRKGAEFGDNFIRNVISRNLHHFARIKLDLREGVGLAERSSRHTDPHTKPEVNTLLEVYRKTELHRCRPGRAYDNIDTDNFTRGINKLRKGKLAKLRVL